ncbi:Tripartite ferrous iron transport system, periplasmic protein EfeO [Pseudomonas syringae pv. coryli]|uniref:Tripartite ferrous iron transport system, periplasmic protein EfeO n=1 Tax=Pseudomonas syringae pv. coryli TaxID=317659 RepID=A0A0P9NIT1_9PSED|nr:Tripartite ferrous iron transport system, periplasmic protein EfeO [Pseudomonas syringae pv. coryli]
MGKHLVELTQAVNQLHTLQADGLHAQQRHAVHAAQADNAGDTLIAVVIACRSQPERAPRFAQRALKRVIDILRRQCLQLGQFSFQGAGRDAKLYQRRPVLRQFAQCIAGGLLFGRRIEQLIERHVALQLVHADQLVEPLGQFGLPIQQLLLVLAAHQKELAGGLITGDPRDGLGFISQRLRCCHPLADIVLGGQVPESAATEGQQQHQQDRCADAQQQGGAAIEHQLRQFQRPLGRADLDVGEQRGQQAHRRQVGADQAGRREHRNLRECRERCPGQRQVADATGDQAQAQARQGQAQGGPAAPGLEAPALGQVMQRVIHRHPDQARAQHQRHDVHAAE